MQQPNELPSAVGARVAGDDYQWLHGWRVCMEMLHEYLINKTENPLAAVGIEVPGVGNFDDIVAYRTQPPHTYMQVKYAVDHRTPVNLAYLDDENILSKMVEAYPGLSAGGTPVDMRLVTNRTIDPTDILMKDLEGRDRRIVPRALQGSTNSDRGKARAQWAAAAGIDESTLAAFLNDLHFDIGYDVDSLRKEVSLLMTANGLLCDDKATTLGQSWVRDRVVAGHRRLTLEEVQQAVEALELQSGSPWATVSIATIKHDLTAEQATVAIDWVDRISGESDWTRVEPTPPATWDDLAADLRTIPSELGTAKRVLVTGHMRQATGFLVGSELRRVLGYQVGIHQGDQLWTGETQSESVHLTTIDTRVDAGPDIALIVNVSTDGSRQALQWIVEAGIPVRDVHSIAPAGGTGAASVPTPVAANSLAISIRDFARDNVPAQGDLHLFLIGPLGLATLLGHHWNRVATTHVYEHIRGPHYVRAFTVQA